LFGCTSKNKAKTAISVALAAKPEVEIWQRPKKINFLTLISYPLLQRVFCYDVPFRHNTKYYVAFPLGAVQRVTQWAWHCLASLSLQLASG